MRASVIFILALFLVGCGSSPPAEFFMLNSIPITKEKSITKHRGCLIIGVGPINIPQYLERTPIVLRDTNNQVFLAEFHRWAEPLKSNIKRVLANDLQILVPACNIHEFPWPLKNRVNYQVTVDFLQFDTNIRGESILLARWSLLSRYGKRLQTRTTKLTLQLSREPDFPAITGAMNRNLTHLARIIAKAIRTIR